MPELPDVIVYLDALRHRIVDQSIERISIKSPFILRTFEPPIDAACGKRVIDIRRIGKRIVLCLEDELFLVIHLMIAGRLRWGDKPIAGKIALASITFDSGALTITEASKKKRASLHFVAGEHALFDFERGGLDVLVAEATQFAAALRRENRTLKRALTDPRLFDGVGNAYSDEILFRARLSPFKRTRDLADDEVVRLGAAARDVLTEWIDRLHAQFGDRFPGPGQITAFRPEFKVHGKFGEACGECGTPIQRVIFAENEMNYCPTCQTEGRILADRSLSRLLRDDWPTTVDDLDH